MRFIQQTRREFLSASFRVGAATIAVSAVPGWPAWPRGDNDGYGALAQAVASQLGTVPFDVEWSQAFAEPISQGRGGRVIHKLATLTPETLVTANEHFFVRTAKPALLGSTENWHIAVGGLVDEPVGLALDSLVPLAESQGVHVLECSGNPRRRSFGLMSACEWVGIPAVDVLELTRPLSRATRVLLGGFDAHSGRGGGMPGNIGCWGRSIFTTSLAVTCLMFSPLMKMLEGRSAMESGVLSCSLRRFISSSFSREATIRFIPIRRE